MNEQQQQYNDSFRAFLTTLNPAQRLAVDKTEGAVLVIAGPGTGKTHILTARIGNILLNTDARAQNILCLTFTEAGANTMRKRLLQRIGAEAHRVPVFTFHGFCNRVIQENIDYFSSGGLEPLTDLERIEQVRDLLIKLPVDHPLRAGKKDVFQYESQVRSLFEHMKKEGWSPGFVIKKADEHLKNLPNNPDFIYQRNTKTAKKGDPKLAQIKDLTEKLERLKAAADLFPKFQIALNQAGRYEYEDMLLWVNRAFTDNIALLRNYQERYQYFLVDEFQDTNGAQFQLLNQLLDYWESPNIFIVGDDDQSIYEFQGARLENLLRFSQQYQKGLEIIVLEENYRSTQGILAAAEKLIKNNELRAVEKLDPPLQKVLKAKTKEDATPILRQYESRWHELAGTVASIEALLGKGTPAEEIAVLYSRHRQANQLQALLGKKGIPYQTKRPQNILELPEIQHFRNLLRYLQAELTQPLSGEPLLFQLLHAVFLGIQPLDLAKIAAAQAKGNAQTTKLQSTPYQSDAVEVFTAKTISWRQALNNPEWLATLPLDSPETLKQLGQNLEKWITDAANLSLPQLIERLYAETGLMNWALNQADKIWYLQVLHSFISALPQPEKKRGSRSKNLSSLAYFLQLLDSMEANNLSLPLQQPVESTPGVQLLTAHAAKGLEFEQVFLFDCTEDAWEKSSGDGRNRFTLPPTLTLSGEEDALEARRRLFYVAMTRAKCGLYISYASQNYEGKPLTQSQFVDETGLEPVSESVSSALLMETQALMLMEVTSPVIELPENYVVDELLDQFSMSITALNRFLRCPLAFWYEDILKVPSAMSEAAAYGIAIHSTLQRFFLKMKADKKLQWPASEQLAKLFQAEMERMQTYFSESGFAQRKALGIENLRRVYLEQIPFWRKRAIVERRVDRIELDGIPLTGVLDKIEWLDSGKIRIVDYKTGVPDTKKTAPPNEQQPLGGDYWRQLAFYQILLQQAHIYPESVEKTAISWLEPDKKGNFPITEITFSSDEIHFVENLIKDSHHKIMQRNFNTGCGKDDCTWCAMHRDRNLKSNLERGGLEEGLDD
jgi:DNA helicase-2/ATP-dependent DNA helicase PcrA